MLLKMIGLGVNNYLHDSFNLFDAVVVSLSLIDWCLAQILTAEQKASVGSSMQALRALRLLRVIKLARSWTSLQDIIRKTVASMKDISNFGVLLFLFMYIYALLGMEMFANQIRLTFDGDIIADIPAFVKSEGIMVAPRYNFDNIYNALVVVFCAILGEDWNNSMYSFIRPGFQNEYIVLFYFLSLLILGNIMLLSLFTAILLQNFEENEEAKEAAAAKPKSNYTVRMLITTTFWRKVWNGIVAIFETKGKKKSKKSDPSTIAPGGPAQQQSNPSMAQSMPNPRDKNAIALPKALQDADGAGAKVNTVTALLHYELNDHPGKSTNKSLKSMKTISKFEDPAELYGRSLFIFGPKNKYRETCDFLSNHSRFGNIVLLLIVISTVGLAVQTPLDDPESVKV